MRRSTQWLLAAIGFGSLVVGCEPSADTVLRPRPAEAYLRDIVVVGDSWMAGAQAGGLTKRLQLDSLPSILATAFGTSIDVGEAFTQPLIANPGFPVYAPFQPKGVFYLAAIDPLLRQRFDWPDSSTFDNAAARRAYFELERDLPRTFRSFAHPGCFAYDVLNARTTDETWTGVNEGDGNLFLDVVLRPNPDSQPFSDSLTVIGQLRTRSPRLALVGLGFDELFHAAAYRDGVVPYGAAEFGTYLGGIVDSLNAETDGRVVVFNRPRLDRLYQFAGLDLTDAERSALLAEDDAYAAATADVALTRGALLIDLRAWYEDMSMDGVVIGGQSLDLGVFGGLTSIDGFSPTSTANALVANLVIQRMNETYGTTMAPINIRRYLDQSVITDIDLPFFDE